MSLTGKINFYDDDGNVVVSLPINPVGGNQTTDISRIQFEGGVESQGVFTFIWADIVSNGNAYATIGRDGETNEFIEKPII